MPRAAGHLSIGAQMGLQDLFATPEGVLRLQMGVAALAALGLWVWAGARPDQRWARWQHPGVQKTLTLLLALVALGCAFAYFYGTRSEGSWLHRWDLYHTSISAKYFPELGHTGLYDCTAVALAERQGTGYVLIQIPRIRNLETNQHRYSSAVLEATTCPARFTPERWHAFVNDIDVFQQLGANWQGMLQDKGYNGTPVYTLIARTIFSTSDLGRPLLRAVAAIDIVLILAGFAVIAARFGLRRALLAAIFFFTFFPNRFTHMGGSFLRFDYVVAVLLGLSAMRSRRYGLAGGLFAYSTLIRVFPVLFAAGLGVKALWHLLSDRRISRRYLQFLTGFAGVAAFLMLLTYGLGQGGAPWQAWLENARGHTRDTAGFRIGFKHLFMLDGNLTGPDGFVPFPEKTVLFQQRQGWYVLACVVLLGMVVAAARKLDDASFVALFGCLAFFLLLASTRYYYSVFVVLTLLGFRWAADRGYAALVGLLFGISAALYAALLRNPFDPWLYNTLASAMFACFFFVLLIWLLVKARALPPDTEPAPRKRAVTEPVSVERTAVAGEPPASRKP